MSTLELLVGRREISLAQKKFEEVLQESLPRRPGEYVIGYQGDSLSTSQLRANASIWYYGRKLTDVANHRFWNAFGLSSELSTVRSNSITVEINFPLEGSVPRIAGMFARDGQGGLAVLHSGKIGGGRKGVGQAEFLSAYDGASVSVADAADLKNTRSALLVARLDSENAAREIARFVVAVGRFKAYRGKADPEALSLKELRELARRAPAVPKRTLQESVVFTRNVYVSEHAKRRANGRCELCGELGPFEFKGKPFLECHHIRPLADNGEDAVSNTVALCPNCHRRMHLAPTGSELARLKKQASR